MKKLLTLITITMLLLSSSLSFAVSNNQQAMTGLLVCYGAYTHLGSTAKAYKTMDIIIPLAERMSTQEVANAKNSAINMIGAVRSKGMTTKEVAVKCDNVMM